MGETKKRVRPTWTQVRTLEAQLAEQIEGTSRLVKDCYLWREKYQKLFAEYMELKSATDDNDIIRSLRDKNTTLERSNDLVKTELDLREAKYKILEEALEERTAEVERLQSRGFWDRLFNR